MFMAPAIWHSGLRHTIQAGNTNKERRAFLSRQPQVRVTTTGLCVVWVRRGITARKVCSCCPTTHCLPAADLPSSRTFVLRGLTPRRSYLPPGTSQGTFFPVIHVDNCVYMRSIHSEWSLVEAVQCQLMQLLRMQEEVGEWSSAEALVDVGKNCNTFGTGNWTGAMLEQTTNLHLFGKCILVNQLFLEKWSHSSQKKKERLSWNRGAFYIKLRLPTFLSFSS